MIRVQQQPRLGAWYNREQNLAYVGYGVLGLALYGLLKLVRG